MVSIRIRMRETKWLFSIIVFLSLGIGTFVDFPFLRPILLSKWIMLLFFLLSICCIIIFNDISRNNGRGFDEYLRRLGYQKSEYKVLYWGGLITLLPIGLFTFYFPTLSLSSPSSGIVVDTITDTVAQILATIFAITFSVTLLSLEYFSQQLSSRIVQSFLKSRLIFIVVGSYLLLIPILLYSTSLLSPDSSTKIALAAAVWGLTCLVSYAVFIYNRIDPISQIELVRRQIPDDFDSKILKKVEERRITAEDSFDRIIDVSNITRRLLQNGDIFIFSQWMTFFFEVEHDYISNRYEDYKSGKVSRGQAYDEINDIMRYFSFINDIILSEVKSVNDERFFRPYLQLLADRFKYSVEIKQESQIKEVVEDFLEVFEYCIKNDQKAEPYQRIIESSITKYVKSHINMGEHSIEHSNTDNSEHHQKIWNIYFDENFRKIGERFVRLSEEEMNDGNKEITLFMSQIFDSLLETVIKTEGNVELRKDLLQKIIYMYSQTYLIARKNDMVFLYINISHLLIGESLNDVQVDLMTHIVDEYEKFVIDRIEQGDERMIEEMRTSHLHLPEDKPRMVNRMVKTLFKGVEADESESPSLLQPIDIILDDMGHLLRDEIRLEAEAILYLYGYETPDYRK